MKEKEVEAYTNALRALSVPGDVRWKITQPDLEVTRAKIRERSAFLRWQLAAIRFANERTEEALSASHQEWIRYLQKRRDLTLARDNRHRIRTCFGNSMMGSALLRKWEAERKREEDQNDE